MTYLPSRQKYEDAIRASAMGTPGGRQRPTVLVAVLLLIIVGSVGYGAWARFLRTPATIAEPSAPAANANQLKGLERARNPLLGLRAAVDVCYQNCSNYHMDSTESPLTYMQFERDASSPDALPRQLVDHEYDQALDAYASTRFAPDPSFDYRVTVAGFVQAIPNDLARRWRKDSDARWVELSPDYKWSVHMADAPSPGRPIRNTLVMPPANARPIAGTRPSAKSAHNPPPSTAKRAQAVRKH